MPARRLSMRKIRDVLRLRFQGGLGCRQIGQSLGLGHSTVAEYLRRAEAAGLRWPLPEPVDEAALERLLFPPIAPFDSRPRTPPDWPAVHRELRRPGVTLFLLWQEYHAVHPDGYQYSRFCELYGRFARKLSPSMRQIHRAGEKVFVDFSGTRPHFIDPRTGEVVGVELFVGALGASGYTYCEAVPGQDLHSWIGVHQRMFRYFGGCPAILVPDNLKSGITRPCRYEPGVNRTYEEMADHYGAVVIPARVRHPRDKPKAEVSVLLAQRWILARLRHRTFFSLPSLNDAIRPELQALNERPMRRLGVNRRQLFEDLDRPALRPLPPHPYELAEWFRGKLNIDYHLEVDHNLYSVPYQLIHESLEARATTTTVEIFFRSRRVASHARRRGRGQYTTCPEHMPPAHRAHLEWTPSRLIRWAEKTGPSAASLVGHILQSRPHPEQGYRACLGLMRLGRSYGAERLEAAARRALHLGSHSFRTVKNILAAGADHLPLEEDKPASPVPDHENIRGAGYSLPPRRPSPAARRCTSARSAWSPAISTADRLLPRPARPDRAGAHRPHRAARHRRRDADRDRAPARRQARRSGDGRPLSHRLPDADAAGPRALDPAHRAQAACRSPAPPTTASARRSISTIPRATASRSTTTGRRSAGSARTA